jgi:hypothetical protein
MSMNGYIPKMLCPIFVDTQYGQAYNPFSEVPKPAMTRVFFRNQNEEIGSG